MVKIKKVEPPAQSASYVMNLPQPPIRNAEEYLKAYVGYIYTAVGAIAQEVASVDLHLFKLSFTRAKPKTQEIYEHPILSALDYVNPISTFYDLIEATQTYLELTGEAFWVVIKEGGTPSEFWLMRPDWIKVIPSATKVIDHYDYYAGGVMSEKVEIPKEYVIPFKYFNPLNPYRGKGATQAAALPFDILNFAQEYNRNFFFNSAVPSMVFSTEQKINEQTTKRFLQQWQASFGGRTKSNKVAFLGNGLKLDKASFGAKELDFNEQMKTMRDDVLAVFKVPKTVLGLTEDVNRANAQATTQAFMERVITPRMRKMVDTLNEYLVPMFTGDDNSIFLDFTDPAPEDVELKLKKYENARQYNWMTPNEIRAEENLEPLEGGDDLFATAAPSAAPGPEEDPEETDTKPTDPGTPDPNEDTDDTPSKPTADDDAKGIRNSIIKWLGGKPVQKKVPYRPNVKARPFKHMVRLPTKRVQQLKTEKLAHEFIEPLKKFIGELIAKDDYSPLLEKKPEKKLTPTEAKIADQITEALKKKSNNEPEIKSDWNEEQKTAFWKQFITKVDSRESQIKEKCKEIFAEQELMVLTRLEDQMKSWRKRMGIKATANQVAPSLEDLSKLWKVMEDVLREIYLEQGAETLDFLGTGGGFNTTTEFATQYLIDYGGTLISGINQTTRDSLMEELGEGFDKGEGYQKLADRVKDVFSIASDSRAEMIARTESIRASNTASVEAYRQSGVVLAKEWLTERDDRTCPFCEHLDGKVIDLEDNYFKKGDKLTIGDLIMKFDYMDVGEPPAHPDCRCTTIPVIDAATQEVPMETEEIEAEVKKVVKKAKEQNPEFQKGVKNIAKEMKAKVKAGPVKTVDRVIEKIENEYDGVPNPLEKVLDTNRATILIDDPAEFETVVDLIREEFGEVLRIKDKFAHEGYKSAIVNVAGPEGVPAEIAVTTPEMWDAKTEGGGDKLYHKVRSGKDETGKFEDKMDKLYEDAQKAVEDRLSSEKDPSEADD